MPDSDALTAVLLQLSGMASQVADLEHRQEAGSAAQRGRVDALASVVHQLKADVASHEEALTAVLQPAPVGTTVPAGTADPISAAIQEVAADQQADICDNSAPAGYQPVAAPPWWKGADLDRDTAVTKLRAWVEQVYRPGYGHLAAGLGECWEQHPLCLYVLDWLSELWSVLYLQPSRNAATLGGQAEWHTRLLPAAAAQLAQETRRCGHPRGAAPDSNWREIQP